MTIQKMPITAEGEKQLTQELDRLKRQERPKIVQAIAEARAHGDLKENAEYHAAKEQQGMMEARVRQIEHRLSHAQVIDIAKLNNEGKVIFGATVVAIHCDTDTKTTLKIVGEDEADLKADKISVTSPIARALIGSFEGDVVDVNTPSGVVSYEILEVKYL